MKKQINIQLITNKTTDHRLKSIVSYIGPLSGGKVCDEFDVTLVDLTDDHIWVNEKNNYCSIDTIKDFASLNSLITGARNSKVIISLPLNLKFRYHYKGTSNHVKQYFDSIWIKDFLPEFKQYILAPLFDLKATIMFGPSDTVVDGINVPSSFHFTKTACQTATTSKSGLSTTIRDGNVFVTGLQFKNAEILKSYLKEIGIIENSEYSAPEWMAEIKKFDDTVQEQIISNCRAVISDNESLIKEAETKLSINNGWKSILYSQGKELVTTVSEIIDEIFGCDTISFVDEGREDLRFSYDGKTVLAEIKGVNHNVKKGNVAQLESHVQEYNDDNPDDVSDRVPWLIINHQRGKNPAEREKVHPDVEKLAVLYGSLIIETPLLLELFELFIRGILTRDDCWRILTKKKGLLELEDLNQ